LLPFWNATASPDEKRRELEDLNKRIGALEETLVETRGHREGLVRELEDLERRSGALARTLRGIDQDLTERSEVMSRLQLEQADRDRALRQQRELLQRQLRRAYILGRQERLKLLLNQEDPGRVSRIMVYHEYLSRNRAEQIRNIRSRVAELQAVEDAVAEERALLAQLRAQQLAERQRLDLLRDRRGALVAGLDRELRDKDTALRALKQDAASMKKLLQRLERIANQAATAAALDQPLSGRKGRLMWPVKGRILAGFGTERAAGGLTWDGVVIAAAGGSKVAALHHGRVAFADWLRGFGLMIILDHGDGYMSLYGFNQTLLKETGEWVEEGETIALVGDSGGRNRTGLYFGIRYRGKPQNPRQWCRRLTGNKTG
jgi:septal ring factor EnvC (AmiA/AmiB activator)